MGGGWACLGDMRGRGACVAGGTCMAGGMHDMHALPPTLRVMVGQCVGGTHPTGMHSYFLNLFYYYYSKATIFILEL